MTVKFTNRATSLLAGAIDAADTVIAVTASTGSRFPSITGDQWFPIVVVNAEGGYEIMRATARTGDNITVTRGAEGTTPLSFDVGARVDCRLTAGALTELGQASGLINDSDVGGDLISDALDTLLAADATMMEYIDDQDDLKVDKTTTVTGTGGLTGGGDLSTNRTLSIATGSNGYGTRTVSASDPSGGSNGDIWYKT